jgi:UDP-glucose 4-epimerase
MIYIDNLAEFLRIIIIKEKSGVFYPQNDEYVSTKEIIKITREAHGKKYHDTKIFNWVIRLFGLIFPFVNKIFGNKVYDRELSKTQENYSVVSVADSIIRSI